jgi:hypothetical protein
MKNWTTHHIYLKTSFRVTLALLVSVAATFAQSSAYQNAHQQASISVGTNNQVSKANGNLAHDEVAIATDPTNSKHLMASSMVYNPETDEYDDIVYVSFDGGKNWESTLHLGFAGDPSLAFGCDGTAYSSDLTTTGPRSEWRTLFHVSHDGGKTWTKSPVPLPFSDREFVSVDCTNGNRRGMVYIWANGVLKSMKGERIAATRVFHTDDQGKTFIEKNFPPNPNGFSTYQMNGAVLSDGSFVAGYTELPANAESQDPDNFTNGKMKTTLRFARSIDGGNNFSPSVEIAKIVLPPGNYINTISLPTLAVDSSDGPFRDRIYAVWCDGTSGRAEVMLSYSTDNGSTWSKPIVVNDDEPFGDGRKGPDDTLGTVAVNKNGVVGISWYDRRESSNDLDWFVRFAVSIDGGKTFLPSVKVSEAAFVNDWTKSININFLNFGGGNFEDSLGGGPLHVSAVVGRAYSHGGDTAANAVDAEGVFHPAWIDNRTGTPQIWTAPVSVNGTAIRNGSRELQNLDDITSNVMLQFSQPKYDPQTKLTTVRASLVNTSSHTVSGPLVVRILNVGSSKLEILHADNHETGKGAIWDFSSTLPGGKLEARKASAAKLLEFQGTDLSLSQPKGKSLVDFQAEVLGKVQHQ